MIGVLFDEPSPFGAFPSAGTANVVFPIFIETKACMVISVPHATRAELRTIARGRVDVSARVWDPEDAAFITWRFSSATGTTLCVRAPVHILLMNIPLASYDPDDILGLGKDREVFLFAQDERLYLRVSRFVQMPQVVSDFLSPALRRQIAHQHMPRQDLRDQVSASVDRYLRSYPSPEEDFASAPVKGRAL